MAKDIKAGITKYSGIKTRPLDTRGISLEATRKIVPDDLYWLIRLLITGEADQKDRPLSVPQHFKRAPSLEYLSRYHPLFDQR